MGLESTTAEISINKFLGMNNKVSEIDLDIREARDLQNFNISEGDLEQRKGSAVLSTAFQDKTDTTAKPITGIFEVDLNGTTEQVATGGDAFKELSGGSWTDRTGAVTITDDDDNLSYAAKLVDTAAAEVLVVAFEQDAPLKWTGAGNATALAGLPGGNFKFPISVSNKLWVQRDDIVFFSGIRDCDSWDTTNDLIRFTEALELRGQVFYGGRIIVFGKKGIYGVSGSSTRDLSVETIIPEEGCASGYSIQVVPSRRYGNVIIYLSTDGILKAFNGTKNVVEIGDPVRPLFDDMNKSRYQFATSGVLAEKSQYWISMTLGSGTTNDRIIYYDYFNDTFTNEKTGRPISSMGYFTGITANAIGVLTVSSKKELVTGGYDGIALQQNINNQDAAANAIEASWTSGQINYGDSTSFKVMTDCAVVTRQDTNVDFSVGVLSAGGTGTATLNAAAIGSLWGSMVWGTDSWSTALSNRYNRCRFTMDAAEQVVRGRFLQFTVNHDTDNQGFRVEELITGMTSGGQVAEYVE